jgi:hypothetical protein
MAGGNLFKRKGLLPFKGQGGGAGDTPPPPAGYAPGTSESHADPSNEDTDDVFMRPTIVPDFSVPPSGLESGPPYAPHTTSGHNVTARPASYNPETKDETTANTFATIPAAANPRSLQPKRNRARDVTPIESPPPGVNSWALHRAIPPPANAPESVQRSIPHPTSRGVFDPHDAHDRRTPLAPPSQPDPWGPTSAVESGHNALGFVDGLPRLTTRPPDREHHFTRRSEDEDRTSVISLSELFALSDFSGALQMAELRLAANPADTEAQRYAQDCRRVLIKMQISRLGSLQQVAELAIDRDELQWLSLDHRAGFILSLVDGQLSIDDLLDICGMQRLDALQIVAELVEKKVIHLRSAHP